MQLKFQISAATLEKSMKNQIKKEQTFQLHWQSKRDMLRCIQLFHTSYISSLTRRRHHLLPQPLSSSPNKE